MGNVIKLRDIEKTLPDFTKWEWDYTPKTGSRCAINTYRFRNVTVEHILKLHTPDLYRIRKKGKKLTLFKSRYQSEIKKYLENSNLW